MAAVLQNNCCLLAQERTDASYNSLKNHLLQNVWNYFSVDRNQEMTTSEEQDGVLDMYKLSASLIGASLSGCTLALDHILSFSAENIGTDIPIPELINSRLPCNFPIPDSWIHRTVRLAVAPLHMACWRLDFVMIQKLLSLGANPDSLAWELVDSRENQSPHRTEGTIEMEDEGCFGRVTLHGSEFNTSSGFSPLHFIALGLRSPPRNSLSDATEQKMIHDVCETYENTFLHLKTTDDVHNPCLSGPEISSLQSFEKTDTHAEIIEGCINLLLSAGANPNRGSAQYLLYYYPLEVIVQPPRKIFYASIMARASQSSESLCRQSFEFSFFQIVRATRTLLHGGSKLSRSFLSTYKWSIRLLDCFYTNRIQKVYGFVESLIFLGVFPDNRQTLERLCTDEERGFCLQKYTTLFLVDAVNISAPESLVALIFKSCSMARLHLFIKSGQTLLTQAGSSIPYLSVLIDLAKKEQLRPLKHICKLTILNSIGFDVQNIDILPLPLPLLRYLKVFRY